MMEKRYAGAVDQANVGDIEDEKEEVPDKSLAATPAKKRLINIQLEDSVPRKGGPPQDQSCCTVF